MAKAVPARNILGAMALGIREKEGGLVVKPPVNFFDYALFALRKHPILTQRLAIYTQKSCRNKRTKMKESKQNDREIRSTGQ